MGAYTRARGRQHAREHEDEEANERRGVMKFLGRIYDLSETTEREREQTQRE